MEMSERRKSELRRLNLNEELDKVLAHRAKVRRAMKEPSSHMHTPKQALKELGERSRRRY